MIKTLSPALGLQRRMASGGEKSAEIVGKIAKNVVQNFRTKEVRTQAVSPSYTSNRIAIPPSSKFPPFNFFSSSSQEVTMDTLWADNTVVIFFLRRFG